MRHRKSALLLLLLWPGIACAYIDPGSGAYAIQVIIAGIAAIGFYLAHPVQWIKTFVRKLLRRK